MVLIIYTHSHNTDTPSEAVNGAPRSQMCAGAVEAVPVVLLQLLKLVTVGQV